MTTFSIIANVELRDEDEVLVEFDEDEHCDLLDEIEAVIDGVVAEFYTRTDESVVGTLSVVAVRPGDVGQIAELLLRQIRALLVRGGDPAVVLRLIGEALAAAEGASP